MNATSTSSNCYACGRNLNIGSATDLIGITACARCRSLLFARRLIGLFIDLAFCLVVFLLTFDRLLRFIPNAHSLNEDTRTTVVIALIYTYVSVFILTRGSINGFSLGHFVTGTRVVDVRNGRPIGILASVIRNAPYVFILNGVIFANFEISSLAAVFNQTFLAISVVYCILLGIFGIITAMHAWSNCTNFLNWSKSCVVWSFYWDKTTAVKSPEVETEIRPR